MNCQIERVTEQAGGFWRGVATEICPSHNVRDAILFQRRSRVIHQLLARPFSKVALDCPDAGDRNSIQARELGTPINWFSDDSALCLRTLPGCGDH